MSIPHHLVRLHLRIETIAEHASVPGKPVSELEDMLAALTPVGRRRVRMLLEQIRAFSEEPDEKVAAECIERRAARVWYGASVSFTTDDAEQEARK